MKYSKNWLIILLLLTICLIFSARGCPKRGRDRRVGSSIPGWSLPAPSGLTAVAVSPYQINLTWQDNSNNEDGFEIERSTNPTTGYSLIATVSANMTSYSDPGPFIPFTTYYYRVRAFNTIGDRSAYSNVASVIAVRPEWQAIAVGGSYSLALNIDRTLWGWGNNTNQQLGLGDTIDRPIPTRIGTDSDWSTIVAPGGSSGSHTLGIKTNGTIWGCGSNAYGQLGFGDTTYDGEIPYQIGSDFDWSTIAAGSAHSVAIKTDGSLWGWGYNGVGQLGLGDTNSRFSPARIGSDADWSTVSVNGDWAEDYTLALKTDGAIWAWGWNEYYQLGLGDTSNRNTPTQIGTDFDWNLITAGVSHVIARKTNGTIWGWGINSYGQLGLGYSADQEIKTPTQIGSNTDWITVVAGYEHTIALINNGSIWSWGDNTYAQLGLGDSGDGTRRKTPTQLGTDSDWSAVTVGFRHNIALKTNGSLWVWGINEDSQLGLGDNNNRNTPTQISFGLLINPPVSLIADYISPSRVDLSWIDIAYNEDGFRIERKIGFNGTWGEIAAVDANVIFYSDLSIVVLPASTYYYRVRAYNIYGNSDYSNEATIAISGNWATIAAGGYHTLGVKTNRTLWSWGDNESGQLGLGDTGINRTTPTQIGTDSDWIEIAGGSFFTLGFKSNRTLWAWGNNQSGQLGIGDTTDRNTPIPVGTDSDWLVVSGTNLSTLTAGSGHTVAIKTNRTLWSWGNNRSGALGLGNSGTGTDRNTPTQVGTDSDWSLVSGSGHTIALKTNGTIWSWGQNGSGQLGLGDATNRNTPTQMGANTDWSFVTAGADYTIAIKSDNTLWGWGNNEIYQLGMGDTNNKTTPSQIGINSNWIAAATKRYHTIARKSDSTIWGWGSNNSGQLGLGYAIYGVTEPTQIGINSDWSIITVGEDHSLALRTNGTLWIWGRNNYGQLGMGDTVDRNVPTLVGE